MKAKTAWEMAQDRAMSEKVVSIPIYLDRLLPVYVAPFRHLDEFSVQELEWQITRAQTWDCGLWVDIAAEATEELSKRVTADEFFRFMDTVTDTRAGVEALLSIAKKTKQFGNSADLMKSPYYKHSPLYKS